MSKRYHLVCHEIAKKFGGAQDMFGFYHRSVYGNIMTAARSRMQHARADKLVYCHEALHMQAKLTSAHYEQKAVRWDSDSDDETDKEEDEKDLAV